jgi:FMN phosphatase YigB (HAD superfamily)
MKYVALDIGNVLVSVDFSVFIKALSRQLNITLEEAEYFMNRTHSLHDMGLTKMSDELHDHFKIKSPIIMDELLSSWNEVIKPNYIMIDKMLSLMKTHNLKVALVSNIGLEHAAKMNQILNRGSFFNQCTLHLSCQVGARKPSKLYYQSFLMRHPEFSHCAYLDDLRENLDAGKQFGFRPFRFALDEAYRGYFVSSEKLDEVENFIIGDEKV